MHVLVSVKISKKKFLKKILKINLKVCLLHPTVTFYLGYFWRTHSLSCVVISCKPHFPLSNLGGNRRRNIWWEMDATVCAYETVQRQVDRLTRSSFNKVAKMRHTPPCRHWSHLDNRPWWGEWIIYHAEGSGHPFWGRKWGFYVKDGLRTVTG